MFTPTLVVEDALPVRVDVIDEVTAAPLSGIATSVVFSRPPEGGGVVVTAFTVLVASARPAPQPPEQVPGSGRELVLIRSLTWAGVSDGFFAISSAARPATCGAAIDVPWYGL